MMPLLPYSVVVVTIMVSGLRVRLCAFLAVVICE